MLDGQAKKLIDPSLQLAGNWLHRKGIGADAVTLAGCAVGIAAAVAIAQQFFLVGLVLVLLSRLADGLDGAVARASQKTDFGGFLDIVLDFGFYGMIPLGFVFADPAANGIAGAVLLLSFYVNGASFLAYAVMAEKRGLETDQRGQKSLFFTTGLAEATETIIVFAAMCVFPHWFGGIALLFAAICFYTALSRIMLARRQFTN